MGKWNIYLRGGALKFQQDQGTNTHGDVEVKQEWFVPAVGGGWIRLVKISYLLGPEMAQRGKALATKPANLSSIPETHMMGENRFSDLHMGVAA